MELPILRLNACPPKQVYVSAMLEVPNARPRERSEPPALSRARPQTKLNKEEAPT